MEERERERAEFVRLVEARKPRAIWPIYSSYALIVLALIAMMALAPELPVLILGGAAIAIAAVGAYHGRWLLEAASDVLANRRSRA